MAVGAAGGDRGGDRLGDQRDRDDHDERAPEQSVDDPEPAEGGVGDRVRLVDARNVPEADPRRERVHGFRRREEDEAGDGEGAALETGAKRRRSRCWPMSGGGDVRRVVSSP